MSHADTHPRGYTIGIITALSHETAAVLAVLGNVKECETQGGGGGRLYWEAELPSRRGGSHRVIVAQAGMGNNVAAIRATQLLSHFPVRHIIMCGIAGGVPHPEKPSEHVRLGDIVASNIKGVVQFDFKKRFRQRKAVRALEEVRAAPHRPSAWLLEGVSALETGMHLGRHPWEQWIAEALTKTAWSRPTVAADQLADSASPNQIIAHPHDPSRRPNQPRVFLGTIASSNTLLKDPVQRDALRDAFGAKAVEMEGSGIQDATWTFEVGYLVVRGICDYCDARKGDDWQKYAAVAAAAYVRALLDVLPGDSPGETESAPNPGGVCELPPPPSDFTGRATELSQITTQIKPSSSRNQRRIGISGMGGVGKSALAYQACWSLREAYPDGQIFVDLQGMNDKPLALKRAMMQIIRSVDNSGLPAPTDKDMLQARYRNVLSKRRVLILLDNARDETLVRKLIDVSPAVGFVITCRKALSLGGLPWIRLNVLSHADAFALLRGIVGRRGTDEELHAVARQCGMLPLALRVAGDFIRLHEHLSVQTFLNDLTDESKRLRALRGNSPEDDVTAVIALSARALVREASELAARWRALTVFPTLFDPEAAAIIWGISDDSTDDQPALVDLTFLMDRSLIQYDSTLGRYGLHDLVRPIARDVFRFGGDDATQDHSRNQLAEAEDRYLQYYELRLMLYDPAVLKQLLQALADTVRKAQPDIAEFAEPNSLLAADLSEADEEEELREIALLLQDLPVTIGYLERRPDCDGKRRSMTNIAISAVKFLRRFIEFCEKKVAGNDVVNRTAFVEKWNELRANRHFGDLLFVIGQAYALLGDWHVAHQYGERTRSYYERYRPRDLNQIESDLRSWRDRALNSLRTAG